MQFPTLNLKPPLARKTQFFVAQKVKLSPTMILRLSLAQRTLVFAAQKVKFSPTLVILISPRIIHLIAPDPALVPPRYTQQTQRNSVGEGG